MSDMARLITTLLRNRHWWLNPSGQPKQNAQPGKDIGVYMTDLEKTRGKTQRDKQLPSSQKDGNLAKAKTATPKPKQPTRVSGLQVHARNKAMTDELRKRIVKMRLAGGMGHWDYLFQLHRIGFIPGAAYRIWDASTSPCSTFAAEFILASQQK